MRIWRSPVVISRPRWPRWGSGYFTGTTRLLSARGHFAGSLATGLPAQTQPSSVLGADDRSDSLVERSQLAS